MGKSKVNTAHLCPIVFGIIMIIIALCIKVPGSVLTTYGFMDGEKTEDYHLGNQYTTIDEYVGGDAYNFEIAASLIAGKTSGAMASKSIFFAGGLMCICFGCTLILLQKEKEESEKETVQVSESPANLPVAEEASNVEM